jgi:serine/threonine-protein kinase
VTDTDEEILADLLLHWEELRELGQETPASELCHDHPQLIEELARRIEALKVISWLDKPIQDRETSVPPSLPSGSPRTLVGRYRLDDLIAEGGFAQVWRAYDLGLQRIVAVKVPKPSRLQSAETFMAEARRVARLKHPGIVPVFDVGREGDLCFIVSEFVEGGSLANHLVNSPPFPQQAVRWIIEIADALEYAHLHGVIHRDIKPANILIDHHNRALLADFGIAQSANKAGKEALSLGTLRYMSPEQLEGKPVDPRSDVFSLGVVLYEVLTGKLPYSSLKPNVLRREIVAGIKHVSDSGISPELKRICERSLQHDPQRRFTSAAHLAADLQRSLSPAKSSSWRWILHIMILAVGMGVFIWWQSQQAPPTLPKVSEEPPVADQMITEPVIETPPVSEPLAMAAPAAEQRSEPPPNPTRSVAELMASGQRQLDQKNFQQADKVFSEIVSLDPENADAYDKRGASKFNLGKYQASLEDFDKAIELAPKRADFCTHRALAYAQLQQFDLGITDAEQALRLNPSDPRKCHDLLARLYSNRAAQKSRDGKYADAATDVTAAIKHDPDAAVFYHQRGSCYFNLKDYEKAATDFGEAIRREPNNGTHYLHRGYALKASGRDGEAAKNFARAKELGANP